MTELEAQLRGKYLSLVGLGKSLDADSSFYDLVSWKEVSFKMIDLLKSEEYYERIIYFVSKWVSSIDWRVICSIPLKDEFIRKFKLYINWGEYTYTIKDFPEDYLWNYRYSIKWDILCSLRPEYQVNRDFILKFIDFFCKKCWGKLWRKKQYSQEFIGEFSDYIYELGSFLEQQKVTSSFLEKYIDRIPWGVVNYSQNLSPDFVIKYADKLDWELIDFHLISPEIAREYGDRIDWDRYVYGDGCKLMGRKINDCLEYIPIEYWEVLPVRKKSIKKFFRRY